MARTPKSKRKRAPKTILKLPDLEQSKSAVLNSLTSPSSQRSYDHAIREFIDWYCSATAGFQQNRRDAISNFAGAAGIRSVNNQPAIGSSTSARLRSFRLWPPESRSGCRHPQGKRRSPPRRPRRQLANRRRGQAPDRRIWHIDFERAEKSGHDRCLDRLRP